MIWDIHHENIKGSKPLDDYARAKIGGPLESFGRHIHRIFLHLTDPNTNSLHTPVRAKAVVHMDGGTVVVNQTNKDMYSAIDLLAERTRKAVMRRVDKKFKH
ncbi:MAG: HPF/RaiA family ribosome-associated protein [Phycisphaeraceae bacterium]|nr:HPF/RaiA family ribosome-associated protein [Phycisphaeraceae bacterium]